MGVHYNVIPSLASFLHIAKSFLHMSFEMLKYVFLVFFKTRYIAIQYPNSFSSLRNCIYLLKWLWSKSIRQKALISQLHSKYMDDNITEYVR